MRFQINSFLIKSKEGKTNVLKEYEEMFKNQKFDEENEKLNKVKRISKLIEAMPESQKATALIQVNKYQINRNKIDEKQESAKKTSIESTSSNESMSIEEVKPVIFNNNKNEIKPNENANNVDIILKNFADNRPNQLCTLNKVQASLAATNNMQSNQNKITKKNNYKANLKHNRSKSNNSRLISYEKQNQNINNQPKKMQNGLNLLLDGSIPTTSSNIGNLLFQCHQNNSLFINNIQYYDFIIM